MTVLLIEDVVIKAYQTYFNKDSFDGNYIDAIEASVVDYRLPKNKTSFKEIATQRLKHKYHSHIINEKLLNFIEDQLKLNNII